MPPMEPPTTPAHALDAERVRQRNLDGHLVADGDDREPRAVGPARPAPSDAGPVVP